MTPDFNESKSLESLFNPESIAIIGASDKQGKPSNRIVKTLKNNFKGKSIQ